MRRNVDDQASESAGLWPPGTVRLEKLHGSDEAELILQPRPSRDPNDPLKWPEWRKYLNFGLVIFYVAMVAEFINAATPTWDPMNEELGYSFELLNDSYAAGCASLAVGSLLLIPFALKFGRRPMYLFSTALQFGLGIWSARMQTAADLMLINVLQCFFGSLAEVIVQMTIADVFFVHQRGRMNAIYVWVWLLASYLGILIAGFIAKRQGWRWIWWWNAIIFGVSMVAFFFAYEETKYSPPEPISTPSLETTTATATGNTEHTDKETISKATICGSQITAHSPEDGIDHAIPRKTYFQRLAITTTTTSATSSTTTFLKHMYQPLVLLGTVPAIAYASLVYGVLVGLGDVMSTMLSTFLTKAPYDFTSDQIGLMSLPRMIGVTIGFLIIGPISDWWIVFLSRRRGGIYEPETRLWCAVPFLLFVPVGALMFGIGLSNHLRWPIIAVGLALYNVGVTPINSIVITYLTDSYTDIIGPALVAVTVVRNTFSTIFIFALTPWIAKVGIKWVLVTILLIAGLILALFGVFIRYGKYFRERSAKSYQYYANRQYKERVDK
ncbi:hypothetical protein PFICI_03380 [Pestalotiopsis fici W106-1]|uniref:Major facilitator superfamily (MFS) profile domain-containing protein n=1 Tax=Pestalotiopsis fici (strain W106-1 / CGMCC3.15140) TaxID=1229662 RepID=W3XH43_PESFW|nr:uncharacterized protein PFICI_03380 [Pestalotiopsis fici W106-1]ETS85355.1 hypothetical protein PFICI_03380 [Pestalotiopsis fici W106-1]